ncbi:sensory box/GGDEF family protein [Striga asiatica]|uniref:Sensory box/GGDEF family protein n=1 Tax=Striga asiatica TaxID=4170 RepID=A0A5A7QII5_STRAF|nr:sensory box/GGDEF family protein [Striga asiatica]
MIDITESSTFKPPPNKSKFCAGRSFRLIPTAVLSAGSPARFRSRRREWGPPASEFPDELRSISKKLCGCRGEAGRKALAEAEIFSPRFPSNCKGEEGGPRAKAALEEDMMGTGVEIRRSVSSECMSWFRSKPHGLLSLSRFFSPAGDLLLLSVSKSGFGKGVKESDILSDLRFSSTACTAGELSSTEDSIFSTSSLVVQLSNKARALSRTLALLWLFKSSTAVHTSLDTRISRSARSRSRACSRRATDSSRKELFGQQPKNRRPSKWMKRSRHSRFSVATIALPTADHCLVASFTFFTMSFFCFCMTDTSSLTREGAVSPLFISVKVKKSSSVIISRELRP